MIYFGLKLRQLRLKAEMTQQQLADQLDVTRATVGQYETGAQYPSVEQLIKIAKYYRVPSDYLLGLSENENRFDISSLTDSQSLLIVDLIHEFESLNAMKSHKV